jgi:hypothetical protein
MTAATGPPASAHGAIGAVITLAAGLTVWAPALLVLVAREGRVNLGLAFVHPCLSARWRSPLTGRHGVRSLAGR